MTVTIYNSLTRCKEPLRPIEPGRVGIYVCGMTVYDLCHLGHARVMVVFDVVVRYLRWIGYKVRYIRNITDVDDKIIRRADEFGIDFRELTGRYIEAMNVDAGYLNIGKPDHEPRATAHIDDIIVMVSRLVEKNHAYQAGNGDVYFRVRSFADYGRLSGEALEDLRSGARVEPDEAKDDPLDFVLWKAAKPGEPSWPSPWGEGRPGWHIECSAMSTCCLGNHFDIHAGGMDLRFPHHENEIAQSEAATGEKFANVWMHNGYVQVDREKMSKSLGNFLTIREILDQDPDRRRMGEVIRYMIVASHYRSPLNYSDESLGNARSALTRLYLALRGAGTASAAAPAGEGDCYLDRFRAAMDDDFNTPGTLAVLFDLARDINRAIDDGEGERAAALAGTMRSLGSVLGLLELPAESFLGSQSCGRDEEIVPGLTAEAIDALVAERIRARGQRQWQRADAIRERLRDQGIVLEDRVDGSTDWRRG
jgi:cysteinyl-tRNA synthetase